MSQTGHRIHLLKKRLRHLNAELKDLLNDSLSKGALKKPLAINPSLEEQIDLKLLRGEKIIALSVPSNYSVRHLELQVEQVISRALLEELIPKKKRKVSWKKFWHTHVIVASKTKEGPKKLIDGKLKLSHYGLDKGTIIRILEFPRKRVKL